MPKLTLKEFLYKFTAVPQKFIDEYYKFYELCETDKYGIPLEKVAKYLGITDERTFKERVRSTLTLSEDYMIMREMQKLTKGVKDAHYVLSFDGFERLCISSTTKKGKEFQDYFIMLRKFIDYYKDHISDKILELTKTNKFMYILAVNKKTNIFKLGRTGDIRKRLQAYSTGKEKHPDIKYILIVEDDKKVEKCSKIFLKTQQYKGNRELYKVECDTLKKVVLSCAEIDKTFNADIIKDKDLDTYVVFDDAKTFEYLNLNGEFIGMTKISKTVKHKPSSKKTKMLPKKTTNK
jgi:phage anti-repressor protein/glutaredoxin-related protein